MHGLCYNLPLNLGALLNCLYCERGYINLEIRYGSDIRCFFKQLHDSKQAGVADCRASSTLATSSTSFLTLDYSLGSWVRFKIRSPLSGTARQFCVRERTMKFAPIPIYFSNVFQIHRLRS